MSRHEGEAAHRHRRAKARRDAETLDPTQQTKVKHTDNAEQETRRGPQAAVPPDEAD